MEVDEERVTEYKTKLEGKLDAYEGILSKQKYLAGTVRIPNFLVVGRCKILILILGSNPR